MALTYGFYPSIDGDRKYSADQWGSIFDGIINPGIYATIGNHFDAYGKGTGMKVTVRSGRAWLMGTWAYNSGEVDVTIPKADDLMDRWDAVCLRIDKRPNYRKTSFTVKQGEPSPSPSPGDYSISDFTRTDTVGEYPIAFVFVKRRTTYIDDSDVINVIGRTNVGAPAFVSAVTELGKIDFTSVYSQLEKSFNRWMVTAENTYDSLLDMCMQEWSNFVDSSNSEWTDIKQVIWSDWSQLRAYYDEQLGDLESRLTTLYNTYNTKLTTLYDTNNNRLNNLYNDNEFRFNTFMQTSTDSFDAFMVRVDEAFDAFEVQKNEEIDEMLSHLGDEFALFWDDFRDRMNTYLSGQEGIWENWFTHIQGQLSEDAATHLQNQIDALTYIYVFDNELVFPFNAASRAGNELILTNPTAITPIPTFAVNTDTGHLDYDSNQTFNVDDTSGHIVWELQE